MAQQWSLEVRPHYTNSTRDSVVLAKAPINPRWRDVALKMGGRWKFPYDEYAWQFIVPEDRAEGVRYSCEKLLAHIYGPQDEEEKVPLGRFDTAQTLQINLDRNGTRWDNSASTSTRPPQAEASGSAPETSVALTTDQTKLATKIAQVVSGIVTKNVDTRMTAHETKVGDIIAKGEKSIADAVKKSDAAVDAVNKRLDQVLQPIVVVIKDAQDNIASQVEITNAHASFGDLLDAVRVLPPEMRNVWLMGPTGSGKTTMAEQLAKALNLPFFFNGAIDTEYKLSGFIDAKGDVVYTAFRRFAESDGGVYLFDEADRSMNSALLAFNAHLAQGWFAFPDKVIMRKPWQIILATGNTWGFGGDVNFVGAGKIDAAFLNRFPAKIHVKYDEMLEKRMAENIGMARAGASGAALALLWYSTIIRTRQLMVQNAAKMIVSPRLTIAGAHLLCGGISRERVVNMVFADLMSHDKWSVVGRAALDFVRDGGR